MSSAAAPEPPRQLPVSRMPLVVLMYAGTLGLVGTSVAVGLDLSGSIDLPRIAQLLYLVATAMSIAALIYSVYLAAGRREFQGQAIAEATAFTELQALSRWDEDEFYRSLRQLQERREQLLRIGAIRTAEYITEHIGIVTVQGRRGPASN